MRYWCSRAPHQKPWERVVMPSASSLPPARILCLSFAVSSLHSCCRRRRRITVSAHSSTGCGAARDPHPGAPALGLQAGSPALSREEPRGRILPSFGILRERNPRSWGAALPALGMGVQGGLTLWGGGMAGVGQGVQPQWDRLLRGCAGHGMGPMGLATFPRVRGSSWSDCPSFPLLTA